MRGIAIGEKTKFETPFFERASFEVKYFSNAGEAVEKINGFRFHFVFIRGEDLREIEIWNLLRKMQERGTLPVLFL